MLFKVTFDVPFFIVVFPVPVIVIVKGGEIVKSFGSTWPEEMMSQHRVEIEIWSASVEDFDPLRVVVVVLAFDADIGVAPEFYHQSSESYFIVGRPIVFESTAWTARSH